MSFVSHKFFFRLMVLTLAWVVPALAQDESAETEGIRLFAPDYYLEFDPISALELVFRTPGFNPREQQGGRGLSGVRSNILIDGERPPPKGQSIRQQLREMPVDGVARIELIDAGARLDIDMQGYPQVVNVVTVANPPAYYEVTSEVLKAGTGDIAQINERNTELEATGSFSWRRHEFTMRGGTRDGSNRSPAGFVDIDPANPEQRIDSLNRSGQKNQNVQLGADFELPRDSSLSFTSRFSSFDSSSAPVSLTTGSSSSSFDVDNDEQDISAEYRRPLSLNGELMLALVDARSTRDSQSSFTDTDAQLTTSLNDRESGETALRLLLTIFPAERLTVRTTVTSAYNFLDGQVRRFENGVEREIEGSGNRVEEDRHSLEASVDWNLSDRWTFQGSFGVESYEIESRDTSSGLQTDPKGNVTISFRPQPRTTLSLESSRQIGQLDLLQFIASSNLSSEIVTAGARELDPVRRWTNTARYDRRFGDAGVLRFRFSREHRDNPVRLVALTDTLIVRQNTSAQDFDIFEGSIEYPLERFGREDLILGVGGRLAHSETVDPVTGETREVSGNTSRYWAVELRRDPGDGRLAWGMSVGRQTREDNFSVNRISEFISSRQWGAYVEWELIDGLKLRTNLDGPRSDTQNLRTFFPVREAGGLNPNSIWRTTTEDDRSASIQLEWRRRDHLEITASLSTRPRSQALRIPILTASPEFPQATGSDTSPRAMLRIRFFR